MKLVTALRLTGRELRGSSRRVVFFTLCLSIGVAAVVAVAGLARGLDSGIRSEARVLLGADLALVSARPLPDQVIAAIPSLDGWQTSTITALATMAAAPSPEAGVPGKSRLVALKTVDARFPFYGNVVLQPPRPLADLLDSDGVVVAPELLPRLGLRVGDTLLIGQAAFTIRAVVTDEPGRVNVAFSLGPRVFISHAGLARTGLGQYGSRVEHRLLLQAPGGEGRLVDALAVTLKSKLPADGSVRLETVRDAQPALRGGLRRTEQFLGLVALVSLLVGGVGVAQTLRAWLAGKLAAIATLKCLGVRPREVLQLYALQTVVLALLGCLVGAVAGTALIAIVPSLLSGLLPRVQLQVFQPLAILRGVALGLGAALLFSLPPLISVLRVPALRAMRSDVEPVPLGRGASLIVVSGLSLGLFALAALQSHSLLQGAVFSGVLAVAALVLGLAARLLQRVAEPAALSATSFPLRHGLKGLSRPGAGTIGAIVSLGLGVTVVLTMYLVHTRLSRELSAELPTSAPTSFMVDIQPDQWPLLQQRLVTWGATRIESVPIVNARLLAIDGKQVRGEAGKPQEDRRDWVMTREQNITYLPELAPGNRIVAGALWSDPSKAEISIEQDFADDLGVKLGDTLTFGIQGVPIDLAVTSLRTIDWKTFGVNFFLVAEPGALDDAPQSRVTACRLPEGQDARVQDALFAEFPNVTVLSIRDILDKVTQIFDRVGLAIRILGSFTVLAGIAILGGAISAGAARRAREVALLKTLGMTRGQVLKAQAVEFALAGAVAGALGAISAAVLSWGILTRVMEISFEIEWWALPAALLATALLAIAAGFAASLSAIRRKPIETLRAE